MQCWAGWHAWGQRANRLDGWQRRIRYGGNLQQDRGYAFAPAHSSGASRVVGAQHGQDEPVPRWLLGSASPGAAGAGCDQIAARESGVAGEGIRRAELRAASDADRRLPRCRGGADEPEAAVVGEVLHGGGFAGEVGAHGVVFMGPARGGEFAEHLVAGG